METKISLIKYILNLCFGSWVKLSITVAAIIFVGIPAMTLAVIWNHQEAIVNKLGEQRFIAKLDKDKFVLEGSHLLRRAKGDVLFIMSANLAGWNRTILSAQVATDRNPYKAYIGEQLPLWGENNNRLLLVDALVSGTVCGELSPETELASTMHTNGIRWVCLSPIPPEQGQFVGLFLMGFAKEPVQNKTFSGYFTYAAKQIIKY